MQPVIRNPLISLIIAGAVLACSSSSDNSPANTATGGTPGAAGTGGTTTIGNAGTVSGSSGTANVAGGGSAGTSTLPEAGTNAGGAGAGGETAAGAGGTAQGGSGGESAAGAGGTGGTTSVAVQEGPFTCSHVLGLLSTGEWYNAGFEDGLNDGEGDHWEGTFVHYGYVNIWADPTSYTWVGPTTSSNCTVGSDAPDRLLYQAVSWELTSQELWEAQLETALDVIIANYPSAVRIDLMTLIRCPDNGYCHDDDPPLDYQPGYNMDATKQDCHIPDFVDAALLSMESKYPGLVKVTPKFEAHACAPNIDGIHLGPENGPVAADIAAYFKGQAVTP